MNLPNKLTIVRIIMIPLFIVFLLCGFWKTAGVIFALASFTDFLDGQIARKQNLVTTFGKFADPLADKLLTASAFLCLIEVAGMYSWIAFVIIAREFIVTGLRLIAMSENRVLAAGRGGKIKTVAQMLSVLVILFFGITGVWMNVIMIFVAVLTVYSGTVYLIENRDLLKVK